MHYDPILCMMVPDKVKDAGGFAPGSKAKIVTENEGSPYESFTVEYGGSPLKRGFKTREAAERYAKKQGLTVDSGKALDKAIRNCDAIPFIVEAKKGNSIMKSIMNFESKEEAEKYLNHKGFTVISIKEAYHK
nr:MAG TPA: Putative oxidoreductase [Caudoviricetes sp.]